MSITPVGASLPMPAIIISPSDGPKPAAMPTPIGTRMRAVSGESRFVMISAMKSTTML